MLVNYHHVEVSSDSSWTNKQEDSSRGRKQQERYPVCDLQLVDTIRKNPTAPGA